MAGSNRDSRLNTWVSTSAHLALERLARHHGVTQRAMLERLIATQDDLVLASLQPESPAGDDYFNFTAVTP